MWNILGSLISGVLSPLMTYLNKKEDVSLEKFKVNGEVDKTLVDAYKVQLTAKRDLLLAQQNHFGGRMMQYLFVYPLGLWWTAIIVYCIFSPYFDWMKPVKALPTNLLPWGAGIMAFLFLGSKIDNWTRRT